MAPPASGVEDLRRAGVPVGGSPPWGACEQQAARRRLLELQSQATTCGALGQEACGQEELVVRS